MFVKALIEEVRFFSLMEIFHDSLALVGVCSEEEQTVGVRVNGVPDGEGTLYTV